jgi:hypothetical protein
MYKNYFNIDDLFLFDIKNKYIFDKRYYAIELKYSSKVRHDVMSYASQGGKYITNFQSLRYLALNPEKIKADKKYPDELIKQIFDISVKGNGVRLWYYRINDDFYLPIQEKSTYKFPEEPYKHFHLCIFNTDYDNYKFDLLIEEDKIYNNAVIINTKQKKKDVRVSIIKKYILHKKLFALYNHKLSY